MRRTLDNWPKLIFIFLPLCLVAIDAAILIEEHLQSDTEKAIRLVKESESRKENFTVQQYLYTTVYHRRTRGEAVTIEGWHARQYQGADGLIRVEFSFTDGSGQHSAAWDVTLANCEVTPQNEMASELSWH